MNSLSNSSFIQQDCERSCTDADLLRPLMNKNILITGGTGFVGKWITEMIIYLNKQFGFNTKIYLLARDIDKFKSEYPIISKNVNIFFIEQDVKYISELPSDINYVVNAAGSPDSREHASQPLRTIDTILKGTSAVLEASYRLPELLNILHVSSNYIYGNVTKDNQKNIFESDLGVMECNSIHSAYSEAKRMSETLCSVYRNQLRLPITIVRPFAFIGPYQKLDKPWAVNSFIREALIGGNIRILGDENTVRSYMYGSDMAYWMLRILTVEYTGQVYNVGSNEGISLLELSKLITKLFNRNIQVTSRYTKDNYNKIHSLVPDISKAKNLDLKNTFSLNESLERTIKWNQLFNNIYR
jgi:nucleoside-diphosphate-sugar epimerase